MDVNKLLWPAQKGCTSSVYCLSVFKLFDVDKLVSCSSGKVESFFKLIIEGQTLGEPERPKAPHFLGNIECGLWLRCRFPWDKDFGSNFAFVSPLTRILEW